MKTRTIALEIRELELLIVALNLLAHCEMVVGRSEGAVQKEKSRLTSKLVLAMAKQISNEP